MISKRVLLAPLDWGLGHATRCIPIIHELMRQQFTVILAGNGVSLSLLQLEFPMLQSYSLPAYDPAYSIADTLVWKMMMQLPKFLRVINEEHIAVEQIVRAEKIDIVISDNRYGCWSARTKNIFITHQLRIAMPAGFGLPGSIVNAFNRRAIRKFDRCWVPDTPGTDNLSGKLSTPFRHTLDFIGPLSRLKAIGDVKKKYDILIILSGPEPQRSVLEVLLAVQLEEITSLQVAVIRGTQQKRTVKYSSTVTVVDFASSGTVNEMMAGAAMIVARSGYSTLMDLAALRKKAIFIPTPGQTEQEYLAARMKKQGVAWFAAQKDFRLSRALEIGKGYSGFTAAFQEGNLLHENIFRLND